MSCAPKLSVFTACLITETNSFSPIPTGLAAFDGWQRRDASILDPDGIGTFARMFRDLAAQDGRDLIESIAAFAQPAGPTIQHVYEGFRDHILEDLRAAGPIGFVLLSLHGAMIASGCDDCEGDILERVRAIVGPDVPIGVELDPHCHLTDKMLSNADAIVIMKEYPHTDWNERAAELYAICSDQLEGRVKPVSAMFDCRMVGFYPTTIAPMSQMVQRFKDVEQLPGILSVSLAHGFPWGDHPDSGTRLLVVADGDEALAARTARQLGHELYAIRAELLPNLLDMDAAFEAARGLQGLIVMADTADNAGGGAPGDTTHLLQRLLALRLGPSAFGTVYDPGAVRVCEDAGAGAQMTLRLGGKLGASSGEPIDLKVQVMALAPEHSQSFMGMVGPLGACAWVRSGETDIVISSVRSQVYGRDAFTGLGISLDDKRVVAVKSSEHFRADFGSIAAHILPVATPGALQMDFAALPYRFRNDRYYPQVGDPLRLDAWSSGN